MSGLLDDLFGPDRDQTRPSDMAQNGGDQPPQEGPIAPSQSAAQTTQQQQQPTQQPTSQEQQQQPSSVAPPPSSTTTQAPPPPSSTSDAPESSSVAPPSSSSTVPPTTSAPASEVLPSSSSSTTQTTRTLTVIASASVSAPGLLSISSKPSASSAAEKGNGKGGVGGSGLPLGAVVGIVIGGLVVIAIIAILATRTVRKRARARRTAHRGSMFEPWPAPVALEDEPYEKPAYSEPAQSYPMQDTNTDYHDPAYPGYADNGSYPPMAGTMPGYDQYGASYGQAPYAAGAAGMGAGAVAGAAVASGAAAEAGLQDNMMVRVKVGFVRSLEDELAVTSGQQLYLHTSYDDGWCLCEDQAQNRGVVPISCLEPWDENAGLAPSTSDTALTNMSARRSSLYQVSAAPNYE